MGSCNENAYTASNNVSSERNWTAGERKQDKQPHILHLIPGVNCSWQ